MIWKECILYAETENGKDELNNPIYELEEVKKTVCRFTPWTDEQIALEGREVTKNEQRFAIPISFSEFPECSYAEIDGVQQKIRDKIDLEPRYTVIQVRVYEKTKS